MRLPWSSESRRARRVRHHKALVQVPFVGRETLLASLDAHMQAAQEGVPQYLVLEEHGWLCLGLGVFGTLIRCLARA
jgi:hypothetical protein